MQIHFLSSFSNQLQVSKHSCTWGLHTIFTCNESNWTIKVENKTSAKANPIS